MLKDGYLNERMKRRYMYVK